MAKTTSDLAGPRFKRQTSRSWGERVTAWPTGWQLLYNFKEGFISPEIFI